jgi:nucleoside-diphosphate-sugar epimerase
MWVEKAEILFHLAGCTGAVKREEYLEVNGLATGNLAEAVSSAGSRAARVVYLSSLAVAGPRTPRDPAVEDQEPDPITPYGESKLLGEKLLRRHLPGNGWTIIRSPVVYGPFDRDVLLLFRLASKGFILQILGVGTEISLIHVDDLVEALLLAGFSEKASGGIYYVSDGESYGRPEINGALRSAAGKGRILPAPAGLMKMAGLFFDAAAWVTGRPFLLNSDKIKEALQAGWVCRPDRIREELGFVPRMKIEEGFRSTYQWYRDNRWIS